MKTEELTAIGLTEEQATQVLAMNGRDIEKYKKQVTTLEGERDNANAQLETANAQLETANATLKKFEGIDPSKIQEEIQSYKDQAEAAEKNYNKQLAQRDKRAWVEQQLDEYGVTSPYARKQLVSEIMSEENGLPWRDGKCFGFADFMESAKKQDNSLYQTAEEKEAAEKAAALKDKAPTFTGPTGDPNPAPAKKFTPPKVF